MHSVRSLQPWCVLTYVLAVSVTHATFQLPQQPSPCTPTHLHALRRSRKWYADWFSNQTQILRAKVIVCLCGVRVRDIHLYSDSVCCLFSCTLRQDASSHIHQCCCCFQVGGSNDSTSCRRPHASKSQLRTVVNMHGRTEDSLRQGTAVIIVSLTARAMPASPRDSLLTGEMHFDCWYTVHRTHNKIRTSRLWHNRQSCCCRQEAINGGCKTSHASACAKCSLAARCSAIMRVFHEWKIFREFQLRAFWLGASNRFSIVKLLCFELLEKCCFL